MSFHRAAFTPLRECLYGIGFHWTTTTMPRVGQPGPFEEAVEAFDVPALAERVAETGAGYVLLTTTHERHHMPAPHPDVDRLIAGRTCRRDLIMEIADALAARGVRLALYYNHGTTVHAPRDGSPPTRAHWMDADWRAAVGGHLADTTTYYENYRRIVGRLGERYGRKVIAWWFDGGLEFPGYPEVPWESMAEAARAGNPERLICYNSGIEEMGFTPVTECQDYWAGEATSLDFRPSGPATPGGWPWHVFLTWHPARNARGEVKKTRSGRWGLDAASRDLAWPPPPVERVAAYLDAFRACGGAVTFNLFCYRDGGILETDLGVMREVRRRYRGAS